MIRDHWGGDPGSARDQPHITSISPHISSPVVRVSGVNVCVNLALRATRRYPYILTSLYPYRRPEDPSRGSGVVPEWRWQVSVGVGFGRWPHPPLQWSRMTCLRRCIMADGCVARALRALPVVDLHVVAHVKWLMQGLCPGRLGGSQTVPRAAMCFDALLLRV